MTKSQIILLCLEPAYLVEIVIFCCAASWEGCDRRLHVWSGDQYLHYHMVHDVVYSAVGGGNQGWKQLFVTMNCFVSSECGWYWNFPRKVFSQASWKWDGSGNIFLRNLYLVFIAKMYVIWGFLGISLSKATWYWPGSPGLPGMHPAPYTYFYKCARQSPDVLPFRLQGWSFSEEFDRV